MRLHYPLEFRLNKRMNWILFDNSRQEYNFISKYWHETNIREVYSPNNGIKIVNWLKGAFKVLDLSCEGDTIICWFDFQAVLVYWIGIFTFRMRRIVCINVMLKNKNTICNRIVSLLYKRALASKNFCASVTSKEYGDWLNNRFDSHYHFQLIRDVFHEFYTLQEYVTEQPNTVFCGGNNGRDWQFMLQVAKQLPNVYFKFVMPQNIHKIMLKDIPKNVTVRYNILYIDFMREMCGSTIVALPLDTIAPAGLIVLFQAAANQRFVVMTDTVTTRGYITSERGILLSNEVLQWVNGISYILKHPEERKAKAKALHTFLASECNEQNFVNSIKQMI